MIESILSYIWTVDCELPKNKKLYTTEINFWRRVARTFRPPKERHKIKEKMRVTQTDLGKLEKKTLKWYGYEARMEDKRWPKRIMTWSPEGRQRRGRPELTWKKEIKKVMKKGILTSDDAVRWQLWRMKNSKTGGRVEN